MLTLDRADRMRRGQEPLSPVDLYNDAQREASALYRHALIHARAVESRTAGRLTVCPECGADLDG